MDDNNEEFYDMESDEDTNSENSASSNDVGVDNFRDFEEEEEDLEDLEEDGSNLINPLEQNKMKDPEDLTEETNDVCPKNPLEQESIETEVFMSMDHTSSKFLEDSFDPINPLEQNKMKDPEDLTEDTNNMCPKSLLEQESIETEAFMFMDHTSSKFLEDSFDPEHTDIGMASVETSSIDPIQQPLFHTPPAAQEFGENYDSSKPIVRDISYLSLQSDRIDDFIERQEFLQFQRMSTISKQKAKKDVERENNALQALRLNPVSRRLAEKKVNAGFVHTRLYDDHKQRELRLKEEKERRIEEFGIVNNLNKTTNCPEHAKQLFEDYLRKKERITEALKEEEDIQNEIIEKVAKVNPRSIKILRKQILRNIKNTMKSMNILEDEKSKEGVLLSYEATEELLRKGGFVPLSNSSSQSNLTRRLWGLLKEPHKPLVSSKNLCSFLMDALAPIEEINLHESRYHEDVSTSTFSNNGIVSIEALNAAERKEVAKEFAKFYSQVRLTTKAPKPEQRNTSSKDLNNAKKSDHLMKAPEERLTSLITPTIASSVKRATTMKVQKQTTGLESAVEKHHNDIEEAVQMVRETLLQLEEEKCTFTPKLFTKNKEVELKETKNYLSAPAHQRLFNDSQARKDKKKTLLAEGVTKTQEEIELEKCTFKPKKFTTTSKKEISKKKPSQLLFKAKNISDRSAPRLSKNFKKRASEAFEKRVNSIKDGREKRMQVQEMLDNAFARTDLSKVRNVQKSEAKPFQHHSDKRAAKRLDDLMKKQAEEEQKKEELAQLKLEEHEAYKASCIRSAVQADLMSQLSKRSTEPLIIIEVAVPGKEKVEILPIWKEDDPVETASVFCSKYQLSTISTKMLECKVRLLFAQALFSEVRAFPS